MSISVYLPTIERDTIDIPEDSLQRWLLSVYALSYPVVSCCSVDVSQTCTAARKRLSLVCRRREHSGLGILRGFQLRCLAHVFPSSRVRTIAFSAFAAGTPVGEDNPDREGVGQPRGLD
ncbi:hypothetical protein EDC04DRAFT_2175489 [Pisolithus marmoratus]|nr:hypothetical protein EDC04DRAFT_2175489 [Pisolithus marmoratus]